MIRSKKTNKQMAAVFKEVGEWFLSLPEEAKVVMSRAYTSADEHECNSPACFGGWLAVKYQTNEYENDNGGHDMRRYYGDGANMFAKDLGFKNKDLGFKNMDDLGRYADENYEIWGNRSGFYMFYEPQAFDEGDKKYTRDNITTKAIGEKLIAVAERLEKTKKV